jgi:pyruvate/2-oxoglutarate dehydrogenase complex dihydrolipoamide acyltransferase (E2) component
MDAATVVLLAIVGVIVAAIALHLIAIVATLGKISRTLVKVKGGVVAIKGQTDPVGDVIGGVASDVAAIDDDLEGLLVLVGEAQAAAAAEPPPPPPARASRPAARRSAPAPAPVRDEVDDVEDLVDFDDEVAVRRPSMREAVARARAGA